MLCYYYLRLSFESYISNIITFLTILFRDINEFPRLLTLAMELLLVSCDDNEADVRLVAGESINKIMKVQTTNYYIYYNTLHLSFSQFFDEILLIFSYFIKINFFSLNMLL